MSQDIQHLMRPGTLSLSSLPPLSLYVHLPWCLKKCPYCDFNSHEWQSGAGADLPEQRYLDAICADLEHSLPLIWGRAVHSIFIGGGTPSLFSPQAIDRLISDLRARLNLEADCEITLEANPGTFEKDRFKAFRAAGVTRLPLVCKVLMMRTSKRLGVCMTANKLLRQWKRLLARSILLTSI
jgi:oxygen-independent coproporphyrinogen-3 oxidase